MAYLDHNATTPLAPEALEAMLPFLGPCFANPSSPHAAGMAAKQAVGEARGTVAGLVGAKTAEIVFTASATEANHMAVLGTLRAVSDRDPARRHVVTTAVEHPATLLLFADLERQGWRVSVLPVDGAGRVSLNDLRAVVDDTTALVSMMWANNETGVLAPIREIAAECAKRNVLFFSDAVQAAGKEAIDVRGIRGLHYLGLSGHKLHAPKGVGALWVRPGAPYSNLLHGGGQEEGRRAGTENVASVVGFGKAAELARGKDVEPIRQRRDRLEAALLERLPGSAVNGAEPRLANTTNMYLGGVEAGPLLLLFDKAGLCASAGSACSSGSVHPSHVLRAMGCSAERAKGSMRFSLDAFTTDEEVDRAIEIVVASIDKLKAAMAS